MEDIKKVYRMTIKQSYLGAKEAIETTVCKAEFAINEDGQLAGFMYDDDGFNYLLAGAMMHEKGIYMMAYYLKEPMLNPTLYQVNYSKHSEAYYGVFSDVDDEFTEMLGKAYFKVTLADNSDEVIEDFNLEYDSIIEKIETTGVDITVLEKARKTFDDVETNISNIIKILIADEDGNKYIS